MLRSLSQCQKVIHASRSCLSEELCSREMCLLFCRNGDRKKNTAVPTVFMYGNVDLLYPCTQHFKPQKQGQQNISGECEEQVDYGGLSEHVKLTSKHQHMQTAEGHLHYVICSNYLRRCSSTTKCFQQNK